MYCIVLFNVYDMFCLYYRILLFKSRPLEVGIHAERSALCREFSGEINKGPPCTLEPLFFSARHGSKNPGFVLRPLSPYAMASLGVA